MRQKTAGWWGAGVAGWAEMVSRRRQLLKALLAGAGPKATKGSSEGLASDEAASNSGLRPFPLGLALGLRQGFRRPRFPCHSVTYGVLRHGPAPSAGAARNGAATWPGRPPDVLESGERRAGGLRWI